MYTYHFLTLLTSLLNFNLPEMFINGYLLLNKFIFIKQLLK